MGKTLGQIAHEGSESARRLGEQWDGEDDWDADLSDLHRAMWESAAKAVTETVAPEGSVVIDRARFERILTTAEAAWEWANAPYDHEHEAGGELWIAAESALTRATMDLQPGDLDELP